MITFDFLISLYFSRQRKETRLKYFQQALDYKSFNIDFSSLEKDVKNWNQNIGFVSIKDESYPKKLLLLEDPPLVLFYYGDIKRINNANYSLAIVGSRNADKFGLDYSFRAAKNFANLNVNIISGMALGVDSAAHCGALDSNKQFSTTAVLGSGLENIYPTRNFKLFNEIIASGGLVISQFEPQERPLAYNFLNRNRIIAALSDNIIVIQASDKSGSLVTARYGVEQGKDIWVLPGDIFNSRYRGSNKLIQQGAQVLTCFEDLAMIYPELKIYSEQINKLDISINENCKQLFRYIKSTGKIDFNSLLKKFNINFLNTTLLELEMQDLIITMPGNFYIAK